LVNTLDEMGIVNIQSYAITKLLPIEVEELKKNNIY